MTVEQIERYIPKIDAEQDKNDEFKKMKEDIAYLLKEVEELKVDQGLPNEIPPETGRSESLRSIDRMHEEKRKTKEEQLLKDHPNFKPSKRLQDSLTELQRE